MGKQVICTYDGALAHPTHRRHVIVGGIKFDASDPLVKAYPWAFDALEGSAETVVREPVRSIPLKRADGDVEQATAAPGEQRTTVRKQTSRKRTSKKTASKKTS